MLEAIIGLFCVCLCTNILYGVMSNTLRLKTREENTHENFVQRSSMYFELLQEACRDSCLIKEVLSQ